MSGPDVTLRDFFAGTALEVLAGDPCFAAAIAGDGAAHSEMKLRLARACFRMADAMLLARGEPIGPAAQERVPGADDDNEAPSPLPVQSTAAPVDPTATPEGALAAALDLLKAPSLQLSDLKQGALGHKRLTELGGRCTDAGRAQLKAAWTERAAQLKQACKAERA